MRRKEGSTPEGQLAVHTPGSTSNMCTVAVLAMRLLMAREQVRANMLEHGNTIEDVQKVRSTCSSSDGAWD